MPSPDPRLQRARHSSDEALRLHPFYRGKVQILPKCAIRDHADLALWYTPGVAAPCREIAADRERVWDHTNRANSIAIVSDGSRVLGLGDIGPEAGLPVMEGKALLFKYLGGVDAVPLSVRAREPRALIALAEAIEPSFGGINLEDIAQPKCFRILDRLRDSMDIPVWHDDQQGTATVALAALINALELVGKEAGDVRVALIGVGAAGVPTYRLFTACGVSPEAIVACDTRGTLHPHRRDLEAASETYPEKWSICQESNGDRVEGGIGEALSGADVAVAFSSPGPGTISPKWIERMADDAIVFACANPTPEIWPWAACEAGARIVATGRCDFPNQVNNSLGFPGIFRGVLDVRASSISDGMAIAAARELAAFARERGIDEESILPRMDEWEVFGRVALATARAAREEGLAGIEFDDDEFLESALAKIEHARRSTDVLMSEGLIPPVPEA